MRCPSCRSEEGKVIDSRTSEGGSAVRRRRVCRQCGRRFTTKERIEEELRLTVIKTDGSRVAYHRENIEGGIERACYKLPVSDEAIRKIVDFVEEELFARHDREVTSEQLGRYVSQHLRSVNPVAYVRFMSVYRKFNTVEEFIEEIQDLRRRVVHDSPRQPALFD